MTVMVPAMAGLIPATVVRKNRRYVPVKVYPMASPTAAEPYPHLALTVSVSVCFFLVLINPSFIFYYLIIVSPIPVEKI